MKRIFKYTLSKDKPTVLPPLSNVIHIGLQNGDPTLWAEVTPDYDMKGGGEYHWLFTGEEIKDYSKMEHQKTLLCEDSGLVHHVYFKRN